MKIKNLIITVSLLFIFTFLSGAKAEAISWGSGLDSALKESESSGKPIMADFYTDWCGWCKKLDNDTYADPKVQDLAGRFICVKINADSDKEAARKYNVRGYPTVLFLDSNGSVIGSIVGYSPPAAFAASMEGILEKYEVPKQKSVQNEEKPVTLDTGTLMDKARKKIEKIKNYNLELSGILYDPKSSKAIINDRIVRVGDEVEGARVISIGRDNVELLVIKQDKKLILKIE